MGSEGSILAERRCDQNVTYTSPLASFPVTLARDLRILQDGGYAITRIMPLDQFRFTPHLEVVALMRKG